MKRPIRFILTIIAAMVGITAFAQKAAIKTNLLYDATLTLNGAVEAKLAPKWTGELSGNLNAWTIDGKNWRQWSVMPEVRYWFCDPFSRHFVGAHLIGGQYNFGGLDIPLNFLGTDFRKLKDSRYQGWFGGLGVAYGYDWLLSKHWNLEAEIGLGWIYTRYDQFRCAGCGKKIATDRPHNYVGPTKIAINLIYLF